MTRNQLFLATSSYSRLIAMKTPPDRRSTYLYLIRHGATEANLQRPHVLQGKGINLPLNELGRQQASALCRFLREFSVHHIYSSPLLRAVETARCVAEEHRHTVHELPDLVEADVGQWEGKDWGSIMREHAEHYRAFMDNPGHTPYLGGESYGDVQRRVRPVLARLLQEHRGETVVVVAHNVVNRVYLAGLLGLDLKFAKGIRQNNTGINLIRDRDDETDLMTLNAHFHLDGLLES